MTRQIIEAAKKGDVSEIARLLDSETSIESEHELLETRDEEEWGTPLLHAIYSKHSLAVRLLLMRGADETVISGNALLPWSSHKDALVFAEHFSPESVFYIRGQKLFKEFKAARLKQASDLFEKVYEYSDRYEYPMKFMLYSERAKKLYTGRCYGEAKLLFEKAIDDLRGTSTLSGTYFDRLLVRLLYQKVKCDKKLNEFKEMGSLDEAIQILDKGHLLREEDKIIYAKICKKKAEYLINNHGMKNKEKLEKAKSILRIGIRTYSLDSAIQLLALVENQLLELDDGTPPPVDEDIYNDLNIVCAILSGYVYDLPVAGGTESFYSPHISKLEKRIEHRGKGYIRYRMPDQIKLTSDFKRYGKTVKNLEIAGYYGVAYCHDQDGHSRLIIAHRGTEPSLNPDLAADLALAMNKIHVKYQVAVYFTDRVIKEYKEEFGKLPDEVHHTGHSLGGAIAEVMVWRFRSAGHFSCTFDSPGTQALIMRLYRNEFEVLNDKEPDSTDIGLLEADCKRLSERMTTFLADPNMINTLQKHLGDMYYIPPLIGGSVRHGVVRSFENFIDERMGEIDKLLKMPGISVPQIKEGQVNQFLFCTKTAIMLFITQTVYGIVNYFQDVQDFSWLLVKKEFPQFYFFKVLGLLLPLLSIFGLKRYENNFDESILGIAGVTNKLLGNTPTSLPNLIIFVKTILKQIKLFLQKVKERVAFVPEIFEDNFKITHSMQRIFESMRLIKNVGAPFRATSNRFRPQGPAEYIEHIFAKIEAGITSSGGPGKFSMLKTPIVQSMLFPKPHQSVDSNLALPVIRSNL